MSPVELTDLRVESGGGGAKSYDGETAWSSINHSILSGKNTHGIHFTSLRFTLDSSNLVYGKRDGKIINVSPLLRLKIQRKFLNKQLIDLCLIFKGFENLRNLNTQWAEGS